MGFLCCFNEVEDIPDTDHPRKEDRCTDFTFLLFFLLFWIGLIFVAVYAFMVGSPSRFIHGSDSFGNVCGHWNERIDNLPFSGLDQTNNPYLFHLNQHDPKRSVKICVRKCPRQNLANMAQIYQFYSRTNSSLCRYDFDFTNSATFAGPSPSSLPYIDQGSDRSVNVSTLNEAGPCPVLPVLPTRSLLYHCVPEIAVLQGIAMGHSVYDFISSYLPLKKVISDVCNAYEEMFIMAIVAIVTSFVSAFVIHFIAHLASWFILVSISVLLVALTSIFWWAYIDAHYNLETFKFKKKLSFILPEDTENDSILLTISIMCTLLTLVILYAASTLRSHVKFVVALFHETAACIRAMPFLLIQPLWTLFALLVFMGAWLLTMMALATADYESRENRYLQPQQSAVDSLMQKGSQLSSFTLINYRNSSWIQYMWWYLVIAIVWISEFILSCQQIVIAGAVTNWYFCRDRENVQSPIRRSIVDLICHHIGSVALGSFLITLFKLPRLIIQQLTSRLRQYEDYRLARQALQACSCCLWVVERFLNYLSRNAYSVVVIENADFCVSAKMAFRALMSNAIKVAAINSIGDFILFLGKLSVASLTAVVGMILVRSNPSLHYWTVPVLLMSIFAFWIAHSLLSVYEMVIDAMFLCFCRDMNRHDGSPGNEYYAPQSLINFLSEDEEELNEIRSNQAQAEAAAGAEAKEDDYATVN